MKKKLIWKRRSLNAVIVGRLEEDRSPVASRLDSNFLDCLQLIVFVNVDSKNGRIYRFEEKDGPADRKSRSASCRLKSKN